MSGKKPPKWYTTLEKRHPNFMDAVQQLGQVVKQEGPLDEKTAHLVQLAAAATLRSEGAFTVMPEELWRRVQSRKKFTTRSLS